MGLGFFLTAPIQLTNVSLPGLDTTPERVMSVYFTHISQSLTGEVHWSLLLQVFHEGALHGCLRVVGFSISIATAGEGVQV